MNDLRFDTASGARCMLCRGAAGSDTNVYGERVCASCMRRMNADIATKRAIMFASPD